MVTCSKTLTTLVSESTVTIESVKNELPLQLCWLEHQEVTPSLVQETPRSGDWSKEPQLGPVQLKMIPYPVAKEQRLAVRIESMRVHNTKGVV
jgi:hypothetical protein